MSFVDQNLSDVKDRHYVMNASASNHWYNFYSRRVESYVRRFRGEFCLIINGSKHYDDAYVLPYSRFKGFFTEDYLDQHNRWVGTIKENRLRLTASGKPTKSISVGTYYNAFTLLGRTNNEADQLAPTDVIVVSTDENLNLDDLRKLIAEFNSLYKSVRPEKRTVVSETVARPNAITDYLKMFQKYRCQICHIPGFAQRNGSLFVEAHHIIELHQLIPGSLCSDNIIIVCPTCHKKLHYASVRYKPMSDNTVRLTINEEYFEFERNVIST